MKPTPTKFYRHITGIASGILHQLETEQVTGFSRTISKFSLRYFISPIDLFPDAIPFLGYLDDYLLLLIGQLSCNSTNADLTSEEVFQAVQKIEEYLQQASSSSS